MGHLGSKTRSLGQIIEKPCPLSRGRIFHWNLVKSCQELHIDDYKAKFESRSSGVKN